MYTTQIKRLIVGLVICFTVFSLCFSFHLSAWAANDGAENQDSNTPIESTSPNDSSSDEPPSESTLNSDVTTPSNDNVSSVESSVSNAASGNDTPPLPTDSTVSIGSTVSTISPLPSDASTPTSNMNPIESTTSNITSNTISSPLGSLPDGYTSLSSNTLLPNQSSVPNQFESTPISPNPDNSNILQNNSDASKPVVSAPDSSDGTPESDTSETTSTVYSRIEPTSENYIPYDPIERSEPESVVSSQSSDASTASAPTSSAPAKQTNQNKGGVSRILIPTMWVSGVLALLFAGALVYFNIMVYRSKKEHPELYPKKEKKTKKDKHAK